MVRFTYFALGVFLGWFIAEFYFAKAGTQLAEETAELRRLSTLVLRGLESAGLVKWAYGCQALKLRRLANCFLNGSMAMGRLVGRPGLELADGSDRGSRLIRRRSP